MVAALQLITLDATPWQAGSGPRRETSAAVWADVVQFVFDAVRTEGALVGANACVRGGRRRVHVRRTRNPVATPPTPGDLVSGAGQLDRLFSSSLCAQPFQAVAIGLA